MDRMQGCGIKKQTFWEFAIDANTLRSEFNSPQGRYLFIKSDTVMKLGVIIFITINL